MSNRKIKWTEEKIEQRSKEGYGQGILSDYKPWITIHDFPSQGRISRVQGFKTNRIHHFLSDLETRLFYLCEWLDNVIDIREKFPLNRVQTSEIAENMNVKHPTDLQTKTTLVMTTDFLLTLSDSTYVAITVLPFSELMKKRTIERLEIERRYWEKQKVQWKMVTDKELSRNVHKNIEWTHPSLFENLSDKEANDLNCLIFELKESVSTIEYVLDSLEAKKGNNPGYFLSILRYAIAHKMIGIDLTKPFQINQLCTELSFPKEELKI